jgi:glycosyltransferase involved in cell wall biosynthesis
MGPATVRLSASVMTHNSLDLLPRCVEALAFCDEVVLVDDHSTDGTLEWAQAQGERVRVVHRRLDNLPSQRRFQQETARGEWLLIVDADEVVTPELAREIRAAIDAPGAPDAFHVPQKNLLPAFWPRPVRFFTSQKRLMRRAAVTWGEAEWVHAPVVHPGRAGRLRGHLVHWSFDSVPHLLKKQLHYGLSTARHLHRQGKRTSLGGIVVHVAVAFFKFYFVRGLVLRGTGGFVVAASLAGSAFVKYAALWELGHGAPASSRERVPGERP